VEDGVISFAFAADLGNVTCSSHIDSISMEEIAIILCDGNLVMTRWSVNADIGQLELGNDYAILKIKSRFTIKRINKYLSQQSFHYHRACKEDHNRKIVQTQSLYDQASVIHP
jgi:hypothetical protein